MDDHTAPTALTRLWSRLGENRATRAAEDQILDAAAGAARTELHPRLSTPRKVTRDEACRRAGLILAAALAEADEARRNAAAVAA